MHIPGPYHSGGRFLRSLAADHGVGNTTTYGNQRFHSLSNPELWEDRHFTDLEDRFCPGCTLRDLGCGTGKASILSTIVRHPLNMFLHRWYACKDRDHMMKKNHASEDALHKKETVCQHTDYVCQPGDYTCQHDNINLQAFVGYNGSWVMTRADLELAKSRLRNFDVIVIVEHLSHTLQLTTTRLGWTTGPLLDRLNSTLHESEQSEDQDRFQRGEITPEQWQQVIERNSLDIELYDYMRELSFGMLQEDRLPVPSEDERIVTPQWKNNVLATTRRSVQEARIE